MRLKCLHHVQFQVADLDALEQFCTDFGLHTVERSAERLVMQTGGGDRCAYVANKGDSDRFVGLAFEVGDAATLDEAVSQFGATPVQDLLLPGGGRFVSLTDPDGNAVLLVHGSARGVAQDAYPDLEHNTPFEKRRFGRNQHPRDRGPARLWRLGHIGLFVRNFRESAAWYAEKLAHHIHRGGTEGLAGVA